MKVFFNQNIRLNEPVRKFMKRNPFTVTLTDEIEKVIDSMIRYGIGSVVVVNENDVPISILTKSDMVKLIFYGCPDLLIKDAIKILEKEHQNLVTIREDAPVTECIRLFVSGNIKHLPVVDKEQRLKGIISATDVIRKFSTFIFLDYLTGFGNRHYLEAIKFRIFRQKKNHPVGILMCDLDNFKKLNDTYGHIWGDKVLKSVAKAIVNNVRPVDDVIRYGGEEFLVVLFKGSEEVVKRIAEKIRKAVENIRFEDNPEIKVTVSIGATLCFSYTKFEDCIKLADEALKKAKEKGKNKVIYYPPLNKPLKHKELWNISFAENRKKENREDTFKS